LINEVGWALPTVPFANKYMFLVGNAHPAVKTFCVFPACRLPAGQDDFVANFEIPIQ
jgi:hypothetical protein